MRRDSADLPAKDREYSYPAGMLGSTTVLPDRLVPGHDMTMADLMRKVAAIRLRRWGVDPEIARMLNVDGEEA